MLRQLAILSFLALFLFSCGDDNSNNPKIDEDIYYFSSIVEDIEEVYTEKGAKLAKSDWDEELLELYKEFQNEIDMQKKVSYKLSDSVLTFFMDDKYQEMPIVMKGDTIMMPIGISNGEYYGLNFALIIDENTIELRKFLVRKDLHFSTGTYGDDFISNQDEEIANLREQSEELDEYEYIAFFYKRIHYKKIR